MSRFLRPLLCGVALLAGAVPARAQAMTGYDNTIAWSREKIGEDHWRLVGGVELDQGDTKIFADEADVLLDENRAIATGNVLFTQGANRIAADRADFNTATRLGTFYNARGIASVQPPKQKVRPGTVAPPPIIGQDNDVYFYGETVEKIGPKKYKITRGGFSTCVQPTPRWSLVAGTVLLNIDHYTVLHEPTLMVKGVPLLYLPFPLYYPTNKEDRATGFLLPTYGISTLRGQQLHNAFFWAINRSMDATITHEFDSKVGQGIGGQYRYNYGALDYGTLRANFLDSHDAVYDDANGGQTLVPGSTSFELHGGMNQLLPGKFRARANVDYFSSITSSQTYNTNIYDASRNNRTYGANVVGVIGGFGLNATYDRTEYFADQNDSTITGSSPRIDLTRSERPLFGSPLYFSATGEYVDLVREAVTTGTDVATTRNDTGLARLDFMPTIRFPFKQWQWFTVNSSLSWRDTYYTRSYDPASVATNPDGSLVTTPVLTDTGLNRQFFTATAQITGPVFNRIWDTPDNGYAEKFKHTIEPTLTIQRTSGIDNYNEIVQIESIDSIVGDASQYTYGVTNHFYAKKHSTVAGVPGQSTEIVSISLSQSYYSDSRSSLVDQQYSTSFTTGSIPSNFSPIALSVRAVPSNSLNGSMSAEFDSRYHSLRTISTNMNYSWSTRLQTSITWSKQLQIAQDSTTGTAQTTANSINFISTVHTLDNRFGGTFSINHDFANELTVQDQVTGFYNTQCCGIAFQYQAYNYNGLNTEIPVPSDHRFFISFTLAGLGNFSPFNGALAGAR